MITVVFINLCENNPPLPIKNIIKNELLRCGFDSNLNFKQWQNQGVLFIKDYADIENYTLDNPIIINFGTEINSEKYTVLTVSNPHPLTAYKNTNGKKNMFYKSMIFQKINYLLCLNNKSEINFI